MLRLVFHRKASPRSRCPSSRPAVIESGSVRNEQAPWDEEIVIGLLSAARAASASKGREEGRKLALAYDGSVSRSLAPIRE